VTRVGRSERRVMLDAGEEGEEGKETLETFKKKRRSVGRSSRLEGKEEEKDGNREGTEGVSFSPLSEERGVQIELPMSASESR